VAERPEHDPDAENDVPDGDHGVLRRPRQTASLLCGPFVIMDLTGQLSNPPDRLRELLEAIRLPSSGAVPFTKKVGQKPSTGYRN